MREFRLNGFEVCRSMMLKYNDESASVRSDAKHHVPFRCWHGQEKRRF